MLRAIQLTDDDVPLEIVLHTPVGLVLAAMQIARAIVAHKGRVTVFVPRHAMSVGKLISMAADEIAMCRHLVLLELMTIYPHPVHRQGGGVEHLPEPRQRQTPAQ